MFLTKECDYAVRVVRSLAGLQIKPVKSICDSEHIPRPFAYKILKKLEHAGLVSSHRGSFGGYRLLMPPESISLLEIVTAVDDRLFLNECLQEGYECSRNTSENFCGVHIELNRVQELLVGALSEKSMVDLI